MTFNDVMCIGFGMGVGLCRLRLTAECHVAELQMIGPAALNRAQARATRVRLRASTTPRKT